MHRKEAHWRHDPDSRTAEESRLLKIRLLYMNNFASINEHHTFNSVLDMRDPDVRGMFRVFLDETDKLFNK